MTKRYGVSISAPAAERLKELQKVLEKTLGFEPSMTQVVEYLILHFKNDNLSSSQNV
jgi:hypothetical protein